MSVRKGYNGPNDTVRPDHSWEIVHGRGLPNGRPGRKSLLIEVDAPPSAVLMFSTASGDFRVPLQRVLQGPVRRLEGEVVAQVARPGSPGVPGVPEPLRAARVSDPERQSDYPAVCSSPRGEIWAAWVEWDGKQDRILAARRTAEGWQLPFEVYSGSSVCSGPAIAAVGDRIWCVWPALVRNDWEILARPVQGGGPVGKVERVTMSKGPDFAVRAAGGSGKLAVVWQSFRNQNGDVFYRERGPRRWGRTIRVSPAGANDWEPDVAIDRSGTAHVVWDSYRAGNYDVYHAAVANRKVSDPQPVANTSRAEFHSSIVVDRRDRVWIAWDEAGANWGKDFSPGSRAAAPGSAGLHASRHLNLKALVGGRLVAPKFPLAPAATPQMQQFAELPRLGVDGNGALHVTFRVWTLRRPSEIFRFYATRLTDQGWTEPEQLPNSTGRNTQYAGVATDNAGKLHAVYSTDNRFPGMPFPDKIAANKYQVLDWALTTGPGPVETPQAAPAGPELLEETGRERTVATYGGTQYQLLFGDLHRHTDIRGHGGVDGSVVDTYRYALDAAQLDFLGVTDHNQATGGRWLDGVRDYQWWDIQRKADLFYFPPRFMGIYAYEHSMSSPAGHRNVIFADRGGRLRLVDRAKPEDNLPERLWKFFAKDANVVDIPHTFAESTQSRALWDWPNPTMEPVLEIYQGARSSYEARDLPEGLRKGRSQVTEGPHFAQDALDKGLKYGFIASSDHFSTHNSYACVWVPVVTRLALVDALKARRCYAATDDIIVTATLNGRPLGEAFKVGKRPRLTAEVTAPNTIRRIDIIRDGMVVYTTRPNQDHASFSWTDNDLQSGQHYYYLRIVQEDVEAPEGDPEMAWLSPWFVSRR